MTMENNTNVYAKAEGFIQVLIAKSHENDSFKDLLIDNPKVAIESVLGTKMTIPNGKKIVVEDQTDPNTVYINIPPQAVMDNYELTEEQLESVSGGFAWVAVIGVIAAGAQIIDWVGEGWNSVK